MGQSGSRGPKVTAQDRAILDMKLQRDKLKQYQKRIEIVTNREKEIAKESMAAGNKERALTALRRKKYQESLLEKTDRQLETLQNLVASIEFSLVEKDVLFGLQQGNSVLKEIHKEMNVESVEKLMGETADAVAYQKEIDEMLMSRMTVEEEEAVQAELAALQAQEIGVDLPSAPTTRLPEPVRVVPPQQEEEAPAAERQPAREALLA